MHCSAPTSNSSHTGRLTYKAQHQYGGACGPQKLSASVAKSKIMSASPLISSPLRAMIIADSYQDDERRVQILRMRQLLNSDEEDAVPEHTSSRSIETDHDGTEAKAQIGTLIRPQEVKVVRIHGRRRSQGSDMASESSFSLAETLVNQSAEQLVRDAVFRQNHSDLAYEVEVLMANARADQERLRNWISSMRGVVERLEHRRKSDARLDASLRLLEHAHSVQAATPRRRSIRA
jgi:hypothetical protein